MRNAFVDELIKVAAEDEKVWLLNADLGYSVLEPFQEKFPDRYLNVGVSEQNMIGVAAGLALSGAKVFVYSIANFPTFRCLEQIRVDVCYHDASVCVVSVGGGFAYGTQGYTHHAIEDIAVMRSLPGMRVAAPTDPMETRAFVRTYTREPGPAYLRLNRGGEPVLHDNMDGLGGPGPVVMAEGSDVTIVVSGAVAAEAMEANKRLAGENVSAQVVAVPLLKPFPDEQLGALLGSSKHIVCVEEHSLIGGLRDALLPTLMRIGYRGGFQALGVADGATKGVIKQQDSMRAHCGIDAASIVGAAKTLIGA